MCCKAGLTAVIQSPSALTDIINERQKARCYAGLHILMLVCFGSVFGEGQAGPLLTLSWHSFPHYQPRKKKKKRGTQSDAPHTLTWRSKKVCHATVGLLERLPTWKYHIPDLSGRLVCNCVLSDLQSPLSQLRTWHFPPMNLFFILWYFSSSATCDQI